MPETTITKEVISLPGLDETLVACNADGSRFTCPAPHRTFIHILNVAIGIQTITIHGQETSNQEQTNDTAVAVPANTGDLRIGPMRPWMVDTDGYVHVTYDAVVTLTVGAFQMGA